METILTDYSISISEFKKNPSSIMRDAGEKPVAVLSHNKPAFYMITPSLFEAMLEELSDRELVA
jgi:antitoxin StbD